MGYKWSDFSQQGVVRVNFTLGQMPCHYTPGAGQRYAVPLPMADHRSLTAKPE